MSNGGVSKAQLAGLLLEAFEVLLDPAHGLPLGVSSGWFVGVS
jgi:hypothetical protein